MKTPAQQHGFNLIEIMFALLLLAVIITVSVETSHGDFAAYNRMKDSTVARWVAFNQLAEVQLDKRFPSLGKREGKSSMGGVNWQWHREVLASGDVNLRKVKVIVFPEGKEAQVLAVEVAYISNPKPRKPTLGGSS